MQKCNGNSALEMYEMKGDFFSFGGLTSTSVAKSHHLDPFAFLAKWGCRQSFGEGWLSLSPQTSWNYATTLRSNEAPLWMEADWKHRTNGIDCWLYDIICTSSFSTEISRTLGGTKRHETPLATRRRHSTANALWCHPLESHRSFRSFVERFRVTWKRSCCWAAADQKAWDFWVCECKKSLRRLLFDDILGRFSDHFIDL